ncbi:MAG: futalosine hydrolase [Chitinophagaceae bacterium]
MRILLFAATEFEIAPTLQAIRDNNWADDVQVVITDVGLMAATYAITKAVATQKPEVMVQAGLAGCIDNTIPLGTTAAVLRESVGDMGVQNGTFTSAFEMGLVKANEYPWKEGKLVNAHEDLLKGTGLPLVDSVTVNEISTAEDRISYYKNGLQAGIESMEGAALHYVGLLEAIPFLQIRSFSNYIGERDKSKWALDGAIEILNLELQRQLAKLL